jgi:hypothetical protein
MITCAKVNLSPSNSINDGEWFWTDENSVKDTTFGAPDS